MCLTSLVLHGLFFDGFAWCHLVCFHIPLEQGTPLPGQRVLQETGQFRKVLPLGFLVWFYLEVKGSI